MTRKSFLLDGPLVLTTERRAVVVQQMAERLVEANVFACAQDSFRVLDHAGFVVMDIALLLEDARAVAQLTVVAKEMSET